MAEEPAVSQEAHGSNIAQATHGGIATVNVYAFPPSLSDQNRARFLVRLRTRYRKLLSQSLHGAVHMMLELASYPEAVSPPVQLLYEPNHEVAHLLPAGTSLMQVYRDAGHELLVVGEPGVGKSTLLLELAFELVTQAEQDHSLLLPVIVPLSSWASQRQPIAQWLSEQIALRYNISLPLSQRWVREERLFPLLDGLDEMEEDNRAACIASINAYHHTHLHPLVVASRKAEYEAATLLERLTLHHAVVVQSLTREQVTAYLEQYGESAAVLRTALHRNLALQEVANTPLMLSILMLTYQDTSVQQLSKKGTQLQQQIWTDYVEQMVKRKGNKERYPLERTRLWLGWLAQQMRKSNQAVFYLEHLQPDWLTDKQQRTYDWLGVRLPAIMIGALVSIIIGWFFFPASGWLPLSEWQELLRDITFGGVLGVLLYPTVSNNSSRTVTKMRQWGGKSPCISVGVGLVMGLIMGVGKNQWLRDGLIFGVLLSAGTFLLQKILFVSPPRFLSVSRQYSKRWTRLVLVMQHAHFWRALLVTLFIGLSFGLGYRLSYVLSMGASSYGISNVLNDGINIGLSNGLSTGLCFGLASIVISLILGYLQEGIHLREHVELTWQNLRNGLFAPTHLYLSLLVAGTLVVFFGLSISLQYGLHLNQNLSLVLSLALSGGLGYGGIFGLLSWLLLGFYQSIKQEQIEDEYRRVPNEGIKRSLGNSRLLGLTIGAMITGTGILAYGVSYGLSAAMNAGLRLGLSTELSKDLGNGLSYGLSYGLSNFWTLLIASCILVWIITGGLVVWRHYLIRFLLRHTQTFPWKASLFLDDAKARIFLQYSHGGYSFTHRLLLDFLADRYEREHENPSHVSSESL